MKRYDIARTIIMDKPYIDSNFKKSLELKLLKELEDRNKFIFINTMKKVLVILLLTLIVAGGGYAGYKLVTANRNTPKIETNTNNDRGSANTGIANPASTNCVEKGGTLKIEDKNGEQMGYCYFSDGSKCEEWAFFRGECKAGENK